jgi:hypothetical protein
MQDGRSCDHLVSYLNPFITSGLNGNVILNACSVTSSLCLTVLFLWESAIFISPVTSVSTIIAFIRSAEAGTLDEP